MYKGKVLKEVIHLDTLYLLVKYPKLDVFKYWYSKVEHVEHRLLKRGIVSGDFVIKGGASCYKVSVWQHDARIFLTDQVDEKIGDGKGSGIWVQLGSKFLIQNIHNLHQAVKDLLFSIGVIGEYPTKINRLDVAIDLFGVNMQDEDLNSWRSGWVGRSKVSSLHFNSRTGALETINIGSRGSAVYLRIYDKVAQATAEGDIEYWRDVWQGYEGTVTRVEWEIKPDDGNFGKDLQDFSLFNSGFTVIELLNYLVDWGRLCIPDANDTNNRRWKDTPLWERVRTAVINFSTGHDYPISRHGKEFHGVSDGYIKFLSGTISGGMARLGLENPNMVTLLTGLSENGHGLESITRTAAKKATLFSKL